MALKIVIKAFWLIFLLSSVNSIYSQNEDCYYTLYKGGKKYKKIFGHVIKDPNTHKVKKNDSILIYYIKNATFVHKVGHHVETVLSSDELKKIKINTLEELGELKELELNLRLRELGIDKYPRPFHNRMIRVYLLDTVNLKKTEVEWLYVVE